MVWCLHLSTTSKTGTKDQSNSLLLSILENNRSSSYIKNFPLLFLYLTTLKKIISQNFHTIVVKNQNPDIPFTIGSEV